jgi:hypothetical protein
MSECAFMPVKMSKGKNHEWTRMNTNKGIRELFSDFVIRHSDFYSLLLPTNKKVKNRALQIRDSA